MTWGADVALYNTAVVALGKFIVSREGNTPLKDIITYKNDAQVALDAIAVPVSATITLPKNYPAL